MQGFEALDAFFALIKQALAGTVDRERLGNIRFSPLSRAARS
jgi:hypothetical protein